MTQLNLYLDDVWGDEADRRINALLEEMGLPKRKVPVIDTIKPTPAAIEAFGDFTRYVGVIHTERIDQRYWD